MPHMQRAQVTDIEQARRRSARVARVMEAQRRMRATAEPERRPGRAWINGVETAEPEQRFAHLAESYD